MTGEKMRQFVLTSPIQGANGSWVEAMYEQFLDAPDSVEESWKAYFTDLIDRGQADTPHGPVVAAFEALGKQGPGRPAAASGGGDVDAAAAAKQGQVLRLINYYRVRGHQAAKLDPWPTSARSRTSGRASTTWTSPISTRCSTPARWPRPTA